MNKEDQLLKLSTTLYNQLNIIWARAIEGKGACYISSMERGDIEELLKEYNETKFPSLPAPPSSPTATAEEDQMEASILKETEEMTLIEWSDPKLGFGRLDLVYKGDGTYTIDAEAMSVKTIIRILKAIGK